MIKGNRTRQLKGGKEYLLVDIDYGVFTKTPSERRKLKLAKLNRTK
jgi:hypothetical protein